MYNIQHYLNALEATKQVRGNDSSNSNQVFHVTIWTPEELEIIKAAILKELNLTK